MELKVAGMSLTDNKLNNDSLQAVDPEIYSSITDEQKRQQDNLIMIASENLVSKAVIEAQGSVLTNKYAEGYAGARYYGGCYFVDQVESLACSRAIARARFLCWERSSWHSTTNPLGRWVMRTAESVLLTC